MTAFMSGHADNLEYVARRQPHAAVYACEGCPGSNQMEQSNHDSHTNTLHNRQAKTTACRGLREQQQSTFFNVLKTSLFTEFYTQLPKRLIL